MRSYMSLMLDDTPKENFRPDWLFGMELDLYFESLNLGVEFQGDQHYIPVYGWDATQAQKMRDRSKRQICAERGVRFMRVEAIDLEYTKLFRLIRRAVHNVPGLRQFITRPNIHPELRELNKQATAYRNTLKQNYGSPTARRKGYTRRLAKYEWLKNNGFVCHRPMTPEERKDAKARKREATKAHLQKLAEMGVVMARAGDPVPRTL